MRTLQMLESSGHLCQSPERLIVFVVTDLCLRPHRCAVQTSSRTMAFMVSQDVKLGALLETESEDNLMF